MNVGELRAFVRNQMEVDEEELPDVILNVYLQEAFDRTIAYSNEWPANESTWEITKLANSSSATLPADLNVPTIVQVRSAYHGHVLTHMDFTYAQTTFGPTSLAANIGNPAYWSVWGNQMYFWPAPALTETFDVMILGHTRPVWTNGAADVPALDYRLHTTLAYFAISLAYARQEDEVLEATYFARWERDLQRQLQAILKPIRNRPVVMHGHSARVWNQWYVNPPVDL